MEELLDVVAAQSKIKIFVPIQKDAKFHTKCDEINATTIIHPFSSFRFCWDSFIMLILVFTCFEVPLTLSFRIVTNDLATGYGGFVLLIDLLLCIDIMFNFRTAFYHKFDALSLVVDPNRIAIHYIKTWFTVDFLTSFPFEFFFPPHVDLGAVPAAIRAFRIIRLARLLKLARLFRMYDIYIIHRLSLYKYIDSIYIGYDY